MWTEETSWDDSYAELIQPAEVFGFDNEGLDQGIDYLVTKYDEFVFPDFDVIMDYLKRDYNDDELATIEDVQKAFYERFVCGASSEYYNCDFVWREVPLAKTMNDYQLYQLNND